MTSEMLLADKYLKVIQSRGKRNLPINRLYRNMRKRGLFLKAYAKIYTNKGATTIGTDPEDTIQGMSLARIDRIIVQLRNGTYHWKPSRRTYVPKQDGTKRPLSIPNWSDKLVQEVIRMILEAYYEPQFRDSLHGFRPNRSCHTALRDIKHTWTGTKWFIEGDIKGCFDSIPHDTIITLLGRSIHDHRFLKLVKEMLRAGYVDDWQYHRSYSGTPQGGIVSPLLANIVLHELDCYVEDVLLPSFTKGKRRQNNREYNRLWEEKRKAKVQDDRKRHEELCRKLRQMPRYDPNDPNYRRLRYVRYADDFLLGFIGPKVEAQRIKSLLGARLQELGLTLSEEKTHITHARTQAARFLGYDITTAWDNMKLSKRQGHKVRALNGTIQLRVPREVSVRWIRRYTRQGKPHYIGGYIELSDYELVETFGAQLRGLTNYYLMADNVGKALGYARWVCLESLRKTLAAKHKIRRPAISYQRYYQDGANPDEWRHIQVTVEREDKRPLIAKCGEIPLRTRPITYSKDSIPLPVICGTKSELLTRLIKGGCELCSRTADLEAHHVNKLKNLQKRWQGKRTKPLWVQFMLSRRRKTIVVCQQCHSKITHGKYDGDRL